MGWCSSVHPIRSKAIPAVLPRLMEACGMRSGARRSLAIVNGVIGLRRHPRRFYAERDQIMP